MDPKLHRSKIRLRQKVDLAKDEYVPGDDTSACRLRPVVGKIVYINRKHRHYGVLYEVNGKKLIEAFKY